MFDAAECAPLKRLAIPLSSLITSAHPVTDVLAEAGGGPGRRRHQAGGKVPLCGGSDPACRGEQAKGQAWRSVRTVWEGSRFDAEMTLLRWGRSAGARVRAGEKSVIRRAHYLEAGAGYPSTDAYLVAAPAGVEDKQRTAKKLDAGFEAKWTQVTGLVGTRWAPVRPFVVPKRSRTVGPVPVRVLRNEQSASEMGADSLISGAG